MIDYQCLVLDLVFHKMRASRMHRIGQLSRLRNDAPLTSSKPMSSTFWRNITTTSSLPSQHTRCASTSPISKKPATTQICSNNLPISDYWRSAFGNVYSSSASRIFESKKTQTTLPESDYWSGAFTNIYSSSASHIFKMAAYKLLCLENPLLDIQAPGYVSRFRNQHLLMYHTVIKRCSRNMA